MPKYTRKLIKDWILETVNNLQLVEEPVCLNYISRNTFYEIMEKELNLSYEDFNKRFPSIATRIHWIGIYPDYVKDSVYVSLEQLKTIAQ